MVWMGESRKFLEHASKVSGGLLSGTAVILIDHFGESLSKCELGLSDLLYLSGGSCATRCIYCDKKLLDSFK